MFPKITSIILLQMVLLSGCTSFKPYKMEIRQGNYITQEMRKKIRTGMSRSQVTAVLGTPLVTDIFHADRWDYIYRLTEKGELTEQQRITIYFEKDIVKQIEEGSMPDGNSARPASGK